MILILSIQKYKLIYYKHIKNLNLKKLIIKAHFSIFNYFFFTYCDS